MCSNARSTIPSALLSFLNVTTDGKRKQRHNHEVLFISKLLREEGIKEIRIAHVNEAGMVEELPLKVGKKVYDIGYRQADGEIFLIEITHYKVK